MSALPLSLDCLPKVSRSSLAQVYSLRPWLFELGDAFAIELGGVGPVRITLDGLAGGPAFSSREELVVVGSDGRRGRVAIELWLALGLVSGCLGRSEPMILRRLGAGERGILAAQLLAILARAGGRATVDLEGGSFPPSEPFVGLALRVQTRAVSGRVRLDLPEGWLASAPRVGDRWQARWLDEARRLRTIGRLELARTLVPGDEWAAASPGDAVVFEGTPMIDLTGDWRVELRIGDHAAAALLDDRGSISLGEPFRDVAPRAIIRTKKEQPTMSAERGDENRAILESAPIEVVAEVGRLILRGDDVLRLGPGSVLALGSRGLEVLLTAGGEPWARGELVDVEGELGVRLTAMLGAAG